MVNFPEGSKSFEKWLQEVANVTQLISYEQYNWKQATVEAILLQTSNPKLERALQENTSYDHLMSMGVAEEQSARGAKLLKKASDSAPNTKVELEVKEEVSKLQSQN